MRPWQPWDPRPKWLSVIPVRPLICDRCYVVRPKKKLCTTRKHLWHTIVNPFQTRSTKPKPKLLPDKCKPLCISLTKATFLVLNGLLQYFFSILSTLLRTSLGGYQPCLFWVQSNSTTKRDSANNWNHSHWLMLTIPSLINVTLASVYILLSLCWLISCFCLKCLCVCSPSFFFRVTVLCLFHVLFAFWSRFHSLS